MDGATQKNDQGFTLIDILIAVVIITILSGAVVFAVRTFTDRGADSTCETDRNIIEQAAELYSSRHGGYPTNLDVLEKQGYVTGLSHNYSYTRTGVSYLLEPTSSGVCAE